MVSKRYTAEWLLRTVLTYSEMVESRKTRSGVSSQPVCIQRHDTSPATIDSSRRVFAYVVGATVRTTSRTSGPVVA